MFTKVFTKRHPKRAFEAETQTNTDLVRVEGIEPSTQAWEARVLPLNYTRIGMY